MPDSLPPTDPLPPLLRYWRNCLADEAKPDLSGMGNAVAVPSDTVCSGALPGDVVDRLWQRWRDIPDQDKPGRDKPGRDKRRGGRDADDRDGTVRVLICLKLLSPDTSHAQRRHGRELGFAAGAVALLRRDGRLVAPDKPAPWIARAHLHPGPRTALVGEIETSDEWLQHNPFSAETWADALAWFDRYWAAVTAGEMPEGYALADECRVDVLSQRAGAGVHLLKLYDRIAKLYDGLPDSGVRPALLERFCRGGPPPVPVGARLRAERFAGPRGTMSDLYGLADSQADAVASFSGLDPAGGELLAVQGPPGTGKTTLLQSIVATEVVRAALDGGEPSVVVGTSTNNQAVLNINEGMNAVLRQNGRGERPVWAKRWIPDCETYGLYLASGKRAEDAAAQGFATATVNGNNAARNWTGFPERERDEGFLARARDMWQARYAEAFGAPLDVPQACEALRDELKRLDGLLREVQAALRAKLACDAWWDERTGGRSKREHIDRVHARIEDGLAGLRARRTRAVRERDRCRAGLHAARAEAACAASRDAGLLRDAAADREGMDRLAADIELALSPVGALELLAGVLPVLRGVASARQCGRVRALLASHPLAPAFAHVAATQDGGAWRRAALAAREGAARRLADLNAECHARAEAAATSVRLAAAELEAASEALRGAEADVARAEEVGAAELAGLHAKLEGGRQAAEALRVAAAGLAMASRRGSDGSGTDAPAPPDPASPDLTPLDLASLDALADRGVRHEMFQKAMRYWEGRWLIECEKVQEALRGQGGREKSGGGVNLNGGRRGVAALYRRWCMVTPCLIVTLHMLPRYFSYWEGEDGSLFGHIDVLVIDEAGQVAPHVGAPAFALAKRAVVVGDVHQTEPIVSLPPMVDRGNGVREGLDRFWEDGLPVDARALSPRRDASQGSIMRIAQEASAFTGPDAEGEPGIFLSEHRRCRAEVIQYCNDLVYRGRLRPMRPEPAQAPPLPPLGWAHVQGACERRAGSQRNQKEAEAVARWIVAHADEWVRHYEPLARTPADALAQVVAVITPFRSQADAIRRALRRLNQACAHDLGRVTVGTVNALQGAERPIVVFSPTYDDTARWLFFDAKPNMLNVAVSRARDSFVAIGDMRVLRRPGASPSALLGRALLERGTELLDVGGNHRFPAELAVSGERVSTLERHLAILHGAVSDAGPGQEVVIVSPFLSWHATEAPPFLELCRRATGRGAVVRVVSDVGLLTGRPGMRGAEAAAALEAAGVAVHRVGRIHSKTLLAGGAITEGSFNWLSARRDAGGSYTRHETSWRITGPNAAAAIQEAKAELRGLGVPVA